MEESKKYPIVEIFKSIQGEGFWVGTPMVFIRLAGCNLSCDFCDTDHEMKQEMTVNEIETWLIDHNLHQHDRFVITGGEPTIHDLHALVMMLKEYGYVHLETNGSNTLPSLGFVWIAMSPKSNTISGFNWILAKEVKLLIGKEVCWDLEHIMKITKAQIFLQPIDGDQKEENLAEALRLIHLYPTRLRLSFQAHKLLNLQ